MSIKMNHFIQNIVKVFGVKIISMVVALGSSILCARLLEPEGKGSFAIATTIAGMGVQFGNLGLHSANTYYISKDKSLFPKVVGNTASYTIIFGVSVILCYGIIYVPLLQHGKAELITTLAILWIPIQLYNMYQQNYFVALDEINKYNILQILSDLLYPILIVMLAITHSEYINAISAIILSMSAGVIVLLIGCFFTKKKTREKASVDLNVFKRFLPFGLKTYVSCLLTYLILRVDMMMVGYFLGDFDTGIYSLAVNLSDIINVFTTSVALVLFPKLAEMETTEERYGFTSKILKYMFAITTGVVAIAFIIAGWGIVFLYGVEYELSIVTFRLLLPGTLCWSITSLLSNYYASENEIEVNNIVSMLGLLANVILNIVLIPRIGVNGAAISSVISYGFILSLSLGWFIRKKRKVFEKKVENK